MTGKRSLNSCFWSILKSILVISAIFVGILFYLYWQARFPTPAAPRTVEYSWQFRQQNFTLKETLYDNIATYYAKKQKGILLGEEETSVAKYLTIPQEDQTFQKLASDLQVLGKSRGLKNDELLDFTLAFVQGIPYDYQKAKVDLTHPRYPYEVLYENKGICSDKTFLADVLVRIEGYGTSVFLFPKEEHMALGIECPKEYSSYNSGFCFSETTAAGNKIGIIPELKDNAQATSLEEMPTLGQEQKLTSTTKLSDPTIIAIKDGTSYQGIIQTVRTINKINSLKKSLSNLSVQISADEKKLDNLSSVLDQVKAAGDYESYNAQVPAYNDLVSKVRNEIDAYNANVASYNSLVKENY